MADNADNSKDSNNDQNEGLVHPLLNPEIGWVKVPEDIGTRGPFLDIDGEMLCAAVAVYVAGLGYAASQGTPTVRVAHIAKAALPGVPLATVKEAAGALVRVGVWTAVGTPDDPQVDTGAGFQIADRDARRRQRSDAGRKGAQARANKEQGQGNDHPEDTPF